MNDDLKINDNRPLFRAISYQQRLTDEIYLLMCGIEHCLPDYRFTPKLDREGYHLHIILSGRGVLSVNGHEQKLRFDQMFVTKPYEDTWYKADSKDPWVYCWMSFSGNVAREWMDCAGFTDGVNWLDCNIDTIRFLDLCKRVLELVDVSPENIIMRTGMLLEFISLAMSSHYKADSSSRKIREYPTDTYVNYAADFIRMNYATAKIGEVAKYIGIHRSYLASLFKEKMNVSPQEYLIQCKMQQAAKFLVETVNPIQEIARQVGYDNPLTFSKTFKNYYGVSPKLYRRQYKESREDSR